MRTHATLDLPSPNDTARLGQALAPLLQAGDTVLLSGPIGAGKTHFARALIQTRLKILGRVEDVPSPTFTLVQTYNVGEIELWHADLYRLSSADELIELGLDEAMSTAITLVEWPDRLGDDTPANACKICFEVEGNGRSAHLVWADPRLEHWMRNMEANA